MDITEVLYPISGARSANTWLANSADQLGDDVESLKGSVAYMPTAF